MNIHFSQLRVGQPALDPDAMEDSRPYVGAQVEWERNELPEGVLPPPEYAKVHDSGKVEKARGPFEIEGQVYVSAMACLAACVAAGYLAFKLLL